MGSGRGSFLRAGQGNKVSVRLVANAAGEHDSDADDEEGFGEVDGVRGRG